MVYLKSLLKVKRGKIIISIRFTNKIKSGEVNLQVNFLDKNLLKYQGLISAKKFRLINAPKVVKSLSSLSFAGINSLLGEGVILNLAMLNLKRLEKN